MRPARWDRACRIPSRRGPPPETVPPVRHAPPRAARRRPGDTALEIQQGQAAERDHGGEQQVDEYPAEIHAGGNAHGAVDAAQRAIHPASQQDDELRDRHGFDQDHRQCHRHMSESHRRITLRRDQRRHHRARHWRQTAARSSRAIGIMRGRISERSNVWLSGFGAGSRRHRSRPGLHHHPDHAAEQNTHRAPPRELRPILSQSAALAAGKCQWPDPGQASA